MKKIKSLFLIGLFLCCGCAGQRLMLSDQTLTAQTLTPQFKILNTVVFKFYGRSMTALGYTEVDRTKQSFSVAALSPAGIKIFEMSFKDGVLNTGYVLPDLLKLGDAGKAIGADIGNIYFDQPQAKYFYNKTGELCEKRFYQNKKLIWRVQYSDYRKVDSKFLPFKIKLKNRLYKYSLMLTTKEVLQ